jgi:hypothetical protein
MTFSYNMVSGNDGDDGVYAQLDPPDTPAAGELTDHG